MAEAPAPVRGILLKQSPSLARGSMCGGSMDRRHVLLERGCLFWSADASDPPLGHVDLSSPCEVRASTDGCFALKPLGGRWAPGGYTGAGTDRIFVFDAQHSEHPTPEEWVAALGEHIRFAAASRKPVGPRFKWMWGDAGFLVHSVARINPGRWSSWRDAEATAADLRAHNNAKSFLRPVEVVSEDGGCRRTFSGIDQAIAFLSGPAWQEEASAPGGAAPRVHDGNTVGEGAGAGASAALSLCGCGGAGALWPDSSCAAPPASDGEVRVLLAQSEGYPAVRVFALPLPAQEVVAEIPSGTQAVRVAERGEFLRVRWKQLEGWVGRKNARPLPGAPEGRAPGLSPLQADRVQLSPAELSGSGEPRRWPPGLDAPPRTPDSPCPQAGPSRPLCEPLGSGAAGSPQGWGRGPAAARAQPRQPGPERAAPAGRAAGRTIPWPLACVDDVVAAMSASAGDGPAVPHITVTPPQSFDEPSPALVPTTPGEAKIHEAQALLADMLTPTPTGRSRGRASRRRSVPPSHGSLMPKAARGSRRALSIEPPAATDALQALNGRMPSFPSSGPRTAEQAEPSGPLPWEPAPSAKLPPAG